MSTCASPGTLVSKLGLFRHTDGGLLSLGNRKWLCHRLTKSWSKVKGCSVFPAVWRECYSDSKMLVHRRVQIAHTQMVKEAVFSHKCFHVCSNVTKANIMAHLGNKKTEWCFLWPVLSDPQTEIHTLLSHRSMRSSTPPLLLNISVLSCL